MIAIKNVLVATDFSDTALAALNYGRELARSYHATLHVVHVVDDIRFRYALDMTPALMVDVQDSLEDAARTQMNGLITAADRTELHAQTFVQTGLSPTDVILEYAKREKVDLIVAGTHGRGGVPRLLLGSVAERLVRLAPCPVLVVRRGEHEFIAPDALTTVTKV